MEYVQIIQEVGMPFPFSFIFSYLNAEEDGRIKR